MALRSVAAPMRGLTLNARVLAWGRDVTGAWSLVDAGSIRSSTTTHLHPLDADTPREAHKQVESSSSVSKVVVSRDA